eukprot:TRINITY_DN39526_c0_g1_i1.p1 TRINITY_DN39526_c0_g1~~TRINITY_DN39526_c0_g1_i1.p1  ORF type:complete len:329 (+),score=88.11 TRINITY_DN39526_c0_g1_i1:84-1070(+)
MSGEDANPLNRRLPAEVISRRRQVVKRVEEKPPDDVVVDLKTALALKPEARVRWLTKACKMVEDKKCTANDLYDIVSARKFCATMQAKNSQKIRAVILENIHMFSDKQQRFLRSEEWAPNTNRRDNDDEEASRREELEDAERSGNAGEVVDKDKDKEKESAGGWTFTVVQRPAADTKNLAGQVRLEKEKKAKEEEARRKKQQEEEQAKQKAQAEEDVDSSLLLLERLNQQQEEPKEDRRREKDSKSKRSRGYSRSRSISAGSVTSSSRGRRRRKDKKRRRSRDRDRDRGRGSGSFDDALRRRMQQRESEIDSARMPVVDPGHAFKNWR